MPLELFSVFLFQLFHILSNLVLIPKEEKNCYVFQLGFQWIVHFSKKTSYHLHMEYKGSSAPIFLYILFWMSFSKKKQNFQQQSERVYWDWVTFGSISSKVKYWVILLPFLAHDFWSFKKIPIQVINSFKIKHFQGGIKNNMVIRFERFSNINSYMHATLK